MNPLPWNQKGNTGFVLLQKLIRREAFSVCVELLKYLLTSRWSLLLVLECFQRPNNFRTAHKAYVPLEGEFHSWTAGSLRNVGAGTRCDDGVRRRKPFFLGLFPSQS